MKVWITKYALTTGIFEAEAQLCDSDLNGQMIKVMYHTNDGGYYHGEGRDWHRTIDSARARLAVLKEKKVSSLLKQIKKIESITF